MSVPGIELKDSCLILKGDWTLDAPAPEFPDKTPDTVDLSSIGKWDSSLIAWLWHIKRLPDGAAIRIVGATGNISKLIALADAGTAKPNGLTQPHQSIPSSSADKSALSQTIRRSNRYKAAVWISNARDASLDALSFLGELFINLAKFSNIKTREHFRAGDWLEEIFQAGCKALPIVAFLSFLVGLILAFVSAIQLKMFGASIYVADLVGISMTREMGSLMTAIIMAGRTGAAYAAEIGAMKRSEELDALKTMGLSPITMVVLPKTIALTAMMPLLSIFATFVGMFAGLTVANSVLDISVFQYINETAHAVPLHDLLIGVLKSIVYGFLVAFAGAWRGSRCGNSADAVGKAATSAVVLSLTLIVLADGIFAVVLNALKL